MLTAHETLMTNAHPDWSHKPDYRRSNRQQTEDALGAGVLAPVPSNWFRVRSSVRRIVPKAQTKLGNLFQECVSTKRNVRLLSLLC